VETHIHRRLRGESETDWKARRDSLPADAVIECHFAQPLKKGQALQLILLAGYYAHASILADSRYRVVGLRAPKAVWEDLLR